MQKFKSGHWIKREGFKSFEPSQINHPWEIRDLEIVGSLSRADRQLGRLDMFSEYVPNLDLFVQMHVTKEATLSSKIEDTKTEMEEAILPEEEIAIERRNDWREVKNYIRALNDATTSLDKLPFSNRLIKSAHRTLMQGVRGESKTPGEFRRSQNWIGGSNPGNARFVPPSQKNVPELMSDLEKFAHNEDLQIPPLIKAAVLHYQFETIHPFLDGNGRIGRLMIPLYLIAGGILKQPVLYLSDYLERNREEYYERLSLVRNKHEISNWIIFFLDGITETSKRGVETFDKILQFERHWEATIQAWKPHSTSGLALFRYLFKHPCVNAQQIASAASVSLPTAYKLIDRFVHNKLLREITGSKRDRLFLFDPYLNLFR
jgi:Fic family protein